MKRVLILVEGQTEETFVRDVLNPHLHANGKTLAPTLVVTKRVKDGPNFKGGITNFAKLEGDLRRLFRDTNAAAVTTMLDYYGLPSDFPGLATRPPDTPAERVVHVETAFANHVNEPRFIPYLSLHEFEALVFASLNQAAWVFDDAQALASLQRDLLNAGGAELINENPHDRALAPHRGRLPALPKGAPRSDGGCRRRTPATSHSVPAFRHLDLETGAAMIGDVRCATLREVTAKLAQARIRIAPGERPVIEHFESAGQI